MMNDEHKAAMLCMLSCKTPVPTELESQRLCVLHFTLSVEQACAEMRRETAAAGRVSAERQAEIASYIVGYAVMLARVASSLRLSDELKKRILNTFLTLMVLRENLDRAASPLEATGVSRIG